MSNILEKIVLTCVALLIVTLMKTCDYVKMQNKNHEIAVLQDSINKIINSPPDTIRINETIIKRIVKKEIVEVKVPKEIYLSDSTLRLYRDSICTDTVVFVYDISTFGTINEIKFGYTLNIPEKIKTITIQQPPLITVKGFYPSEWILGLSVYGGLRDSLNGSDKVISLEYMNNNGIGFVGGYHIDHKYYEGGIKFSLNRLIKKWRE